MVGIENAKQKYDSLEVYFAKNEIGKHDPGTMSCHGGFGGDFVLRTVVREHKVFSN